MATVLITGTSTGIGFETALALGRAGYNVYAGMRAPENTPELSEIAHKELLPITIVPLDVDDDVSVKNMVHKILTKFGSIDVLVNNAGIMPIGTTEELPFAEFKNTMETNFFGALRCIQAVLPGMREKNKGTIINISSISGRMAFAPVGAYAASKFALEAFSEILAQEVKSFGIRVFIIEPGAIKTPILEKKRKVLSNSFYPHESRLNALLSTAVENATSPVIVGEKIREIIQSNINWQLRWPVGPDADPLIKWRSGMSDEEWVDLWATKDDDEWYKKIKDQIGLDLRPK